MKNYVQEGDTLTLVAPYAVTSGQGLKVGSIFGVASTDAALGANTEAAVCGVFDLAAVSANTPAQGAAVYWDDVARLVTTVASGNTKIGVSTETKLAGAATARVRLNASF
jgi:predicted RecA/RadA family phage recombinase